MTIIVERLTEDQALERRDAIIQQVGDEQVFRDRAAEYALDSAERALFDELQALDFLLGR